MNVLPGVIAPGAKAFGGSASDLSYWPRGEPALGLQPRDGPIRLDSSARVAPGIAWANYRQWR